MDLWYLVCSLLVFVGGIGFQVVFRPFKPRRVPTLHEYQKSEVGALQHTIAEVYKHVQTNHDMLVQVQAGVRSAGARLDDIDVVAARLVDVLNNVATVMTKLFERLQTLEELTRPRSDTGPQ